MGRLVFVCNADVALGFAAGGLEVVAASDPSVAVQVVETLLEDTGVSLVGVVMPWYERLPERLLRRAGTGSRPIVCPMDDFNRRPERTAAEEHLVRLVRRAVGYHLKLRLRHEE